MMATQERARPEPESQDRQILKALLAALADPARATALADDDGVLAVARHHRLSPLLAVVCKERLPGYLGEACRRDRAITAARNLVLSEAAEELLIALGERGIDGVLLKGLAYEARLYPAPGSRPTGDVDLLVQEQHRREAFTVLVALGFEPWAAAAGFDEPDYHEVAFSRGHVSVDLHLSLAPRARCAVDDAALFRDAESIVFGRARAFVLSPTHAAVFHALHMAIDHFDVPAVYLLDLARLLPASDDVARAGEVARAWRCRRPFATSRALAAAFVPEWTPGAGPPTGGPLPDGPEDREAKRVVAAYGPITRLPRAEQLRRKLVHFDRPSDAVRYVAVQARRNARELLERRLRRHSPRARLGL